MGHPDDSFLPKRTDTEIYGRAPFDRLRGRSRMTASDYWAERPRVICVPLSSAMFLPAAVRVPEVSPDAELESMTPGIEVARAMETVLPTAPRVSDATPEAVLPAA